MMERSTDIFKSLHENRDDLLARIIVKGLQLSIDEGHRALETLADQRVITLQQGRIDLARSIIKCITDPNIPQKGKK
jgi:hypothetical protein